MMIAYVKAANEIDGWSIADIDDECSLTWWCGEHGWVSPYSSYWATDPDCREECYSSLEAARAEAIALGLEHP